MRRPLALLVPCALSAQVQELFKPDQQSWTVAYDDAETAYRQGRYADALKYYRRAVELTRKRPGRNIHTYGTNFIDYYPYLGMARCALALGDLASAEAALKQSEALGGEPAGEREKLRQQLAQRMVKPALPDPKSSSQLPTEKQPDLPPTPRTEPSPERKPEPATESRPAPPPPMPKPAPGVDRPAAREVTRPAEPSMVKPQAPLASLASQSTTTAPPARPAPPSRWPWWAGGITLAAGVGFVLHRRRQHRNPYGVDLRPPTSGNLRRNGATPSRPEGVGSATEFGGSRTPTHLGPFRVLELLGRGGCATTFLGVHERTGQKAALKVPHPHVLADPDFRTRFWREAELGRVLDHPRIPRILEAGPEDDPWLAMAYVAGITLEDHLKGVRPLPLNQAVHIALDVAEALAHAHAKGVVHRDLKPSNIMLGEGGAIVLDFGIARLLDTTNTATALLIGTPAYFAPEGLQSARVGPGADRYALGIILFEMLAGEKPFTGENPFHVLEQHRTAPLPDLQALRPEVPARLVRLLERLCRKEPSERPEDLETLEILRTLGAAHPLGG